MYCAYFEVDASIKIVAPVLLLMCFCLFQSLNRQLPPSDVFGHWELLDALNKVNQELGLIIDLTYTTRYYKIEVGIF